MECSPEAARSQKRQDLYDKFMCYCKTGTQDLEASIAAAEELRHELARAVVDTPRSRRGELAGRARSHCVAVSFATSLGSGWGGCLPSASRGLAKMTDSPQGSLLPSSVAGEAAVVGVLAPPFAHALHFPPCPRLLPRRVFALSDGGLAVPRPSLACRRSPARSVAASFCAPAPRCWCCGNRERRSQSHMGPEQHVRPRIRSGSRGAAQPKHRRAPRNQARGNIHRPAS